MDRQQENEKQIQNIALEVARMGNAPANILSQIGKAKSFSEAISIGGKYMYDPLEKSIKNAQLRKLNSEIAKSDSSYKEAVVSSVVNEKDPTKLISEFFKANPKLKTNPAINDAGAVVSSVAELAKSPCTPLMYRCRCLWVVNAASTKVYVDSWWF